MTHPKFDEVWQVSSYQELTRQSRAKAAAAAESTRAATAVAAIRSSKTPDELIDVLVGVIEELAAERRAARSTTER